MKSLLLYAGFFVIIGGWAWIHIKALSPEGLPFAHKISLWLLSKKLLREEVLELLEENRKLRIDVIDLGFRNRQNFNMRVKAEDLLHEALKHHESPDSSASPPQWVSNASSYFRKKEG